MPTVFYIVRCFISVEFGTAERGLCCIKLKKTTMKSKKKDPYNTTVLTSNKYHKTKLSLEIGSYKLCDYSPLTLKCTPLKSLC